jgi:hypothetical protein
MNYHWRDEANCKGMDPSLFISAGIRPRGRRREVLEKVCTDCPVILLCRKYALELTAKSSHPAIGWWGGMDEAERIEWGKREGLL